MKFLVPKLRFEPTSIALTAAHEEEAELPKDRFARQELGNVTN